MSFFQKFVRGRGLTRKLPRPVAIAVQNAYQALNRGRALHIARLRPRIPFDGRKVIVAGLFSHGTGLARAAELVCLQLQSQGSQVVRIDVGPELGQPSGRELSDQRLASAKHRFDDATDLIVALNPDFDVVRYFDADLLRRVSVNAHWIWEIEKAPAFWRRRTVSFDRIFAPTEWVKQSFETSLQGADIDILPYGVDLDPWPAPTAAARLAAREKLEIEPSAVVVGYSFSALSNYYRKNPEALVAAFQSAFRNDDRARLLLRTHDIHHRPAEEQRLRNAIGADRRIILFTSDRRISLDDFYASIDVYASPSRAEGYGLNLIEASQAGIPVIASGWRLPEEIRTRPNITTVSYDVVKLSDPQGHYAGIADAEWSEPHVDDLARKLQLCRSLNRQSH